MNCSAHDCPNEPLVRYEIRNSEGAPESLRFPVYCAVHTAAAEDNPSVFRRVEVLDQENPDAR